MSSPGVYCDECGDIMSTQGMFSTPGFPYKLNSSIDDLPHINVNV